MLRSKGLTDKLLLLGIDGLDPRFTKKMIEEGRMPNTKRMVERGAARDDLMLLGAIPTITPPMWATLGTGAYPMTHGIVDYNMGVPGHMEINQGGFFSKFCKAEPLWNVAAEAGLKTLVWHWPGGAWPPTIDNENLMMVDGTSPGNIGMGYASCDRDTLVIASSKAEEFAFTFFGTVDSRLEGDENLKPLSMGDTIQRKWDDELQAIFDEYREGVEVNGYQCNQSDIGANISDKVTTMEILAKFPVCASLSPITAPQGWRAAVPQDAKEFMLKFEYGRASRYCLLLCDDAGKYDRIAMYADKAAEQPLVILERDVFTTHVYDTTQTANGTAKVYRNMRALQIAEDGSYVKLWLSGAINVDIDTVWYPKSIYQEIKDHFGPPLPTSQLSGQDPELILKCNNEQWALSAKWQSDCLHYMIDEHDVQVIFSHYHGPDLAGHCYMKYMKNREDSILNEQEIRRFAEDTYETTDKYIGSFLHYLDEGWTILVFSDHALVCPEHDTVPLGNNGAVNIELLSRLGYTTVLKDEKGRNLPVIDWEKTTAFQARSNSIYINLSGRDPYGIVAPEDKYELEERIITDLYNYRDEKTGHRVIAFALHNKDAILLGLGGPYGADITFCVHEDYVFDHGNSMSTACGHNDTSVSPIFIAAGQGIKEGYVLKRYVREVDIAPTSAVLLGVDIPAQCEGAPAYQILTEKL